MAAYTTGFDSYTVGAIPSDWTARWVTTSTTWAVRAKSAVEGGQTLEYTGTANARHLLTWNAIDADANRDNVEVLARVRTSNNSSEPLRITLRGSGAAGAENGYIFQYSASSLLWQFQKLVAGTLSNIGSSVNFTTVGNVWYYVRFRVNGTTLSAKFWRDGDNEPSSWTLTVTDSSVTGVGWVGLDNLDSTGTRDCDLFSVGTNGDTVTLHSVTATTIRASQAVAEVALSNVAVERVSQLVAEVALSNAAVERVSQLVVELAISAPIAGQVSQMVVEVAFSNVTAVTQQPRMIVLM